MLKLLLQLQQLAPRKHRPRLRLAQALRHRLRLLKPVQQRRPRQRLKQVQVLLRQNLVGIFI